MFYTKKNYLCIQNNFEYVLEINYYSQHKHIKYCREPNCIINDAESMLFIRSDKQ